MKRKLQTGLVALSVAAVLSGCSSGDSFKKTFGLTANPPDAFQVGTQPPLSLPPELGQLPPPNPGQPRPQQADAAQQGLDTLSPASSIAADTASNSAGQQAFLTQAGPTPSPTIRADVNQTSLIASKPASFVGNLMGKGPTPEPTVDAAAENRRLQENAALGQPATTGNTPMDSNQSPGLFQRFLNLF
jgi:Protein of unknown function (DUF3035)